MSELKQRLAYAIDELCESANLGRTTVYKDIAEGRLRAVKNGRRTVILHDDAMAFLAALPAIEPRAPLPDQWTNCQAADRDCRKRNRPPAPNLGCPHRQPGAAHRD